MYNYRIVATGSRRHCMSGNYTLMTGAVAERPAGGDAVTDHRDGT